MVAVFGLVELSGFVSNGYGFGRGIVTGIERNAASTW